DTECHGVGEQQNPARVGLDGVIVAVAERVYLHLGVDPAIIFVPVPVRGVGPANLVVWRPKARESLGLGRRWREVIQSREIDEEQRHVRRQTCQENTEYPEGRTHERNARGGCSYCTWSGSTIP